MRALASLLLLGGAALAAPPLFSPPTALTDADATLSDDWQVMGFDDDGDVIGLLRRGGLAHADPADVDGTLVTIPAGAPGIGSPVFTGWGMTHDDAGVWRVGANATRMIAQRIVDLDAEGATTYDLPLDADADWTAFGEALPGGGFTVLGTPRGFCLWSDRSVWCVDVEARAVRKRLDKALLDAHVRIPAGHYAAVANFFDTPPSDTIHTFWHLDDAVALPDDGLVVLARVGLGYNDRRQVDGSGFTRYLLRLDADGAIDIFYGPLRGWSDGPRRTPAEDPLNDAQLAYWPDERAVVANVTRFDYGWQDIRSPTLPLGHPDNDPHGWRGRGLRVFPIDRPGRGAISLTDAVVRRLTCEQGGFPENCQNRTTRVLRHGDGGLRVLIQATRGTSQHETQIHRFAGKRGALDLDGDGLIASEEQRHGTSDLLADSDGGGNEDGAEVDLLGSDPTDAGDDLVAPLRADSPVRFLASPMVRLRLPDGPTDWAQTFAPGAPLCARGACYDARGDVTLRWGLPGDGEAMVAVDNSHLLVWTDDDALHRVDLTDGRRTPYLTLEDLRAALPRSDEGRAGWGPLGTNSITVVPLDAHRTLVAGRFFPARVVIFEDGAPRTLYDGVEARCAAGLGPCDEGPMPVAPNLTRLTGGGLPVGGGLPPNHVPVNDVYDIELTPIGYDPAAGHFVFGVFGTWQTWVLGVHPDRPPYVLATQRDLQSLADARLPDARIGPPRMPTWLVPTGHGEVLTDVGLFDPTWAPIAADLTALRIDRRPTAVWGDTILTGHRSGGDEDGAYELVRGGGALGGGDLLVLTHGETDFIEGERTRRSALTLYHGGRKGGLRRVWTFEDTGAAVEIGALLDGLVGMDVSADGRLCATDGEHVVTFYGVAETGLVPRVPLWRVALPGALDCAFEGDALLGLTADGVQRFEIASETFGA
ncbi:MAG: hypothetical protein KC583_17400, partial [Myxococcales bacterium]|nr:hypothetical protein [Myxococcales bacterium]